MGLDEYRKKRNFRSTPEPAGSLAKNARPLRFVIHKHAASHLHYDLRLELDGVLKSWAVPKGPSLDPSLKRLAVMVEDHPIDYGQFEGIIPKGNYGAGTVIIWDEGTYTPYESHGRSADEIELRAELNKGDLKFTLNGKKLNGKFALVRIRSDEQNTWLLIKKQDDFATTSDPTSDDRSVASGKRVEDLEHNHEPAPQTEPHTEHPSIPFLDKAPPGPMPHGIKPMLATLVEEPFDGAEWLFEIKQDGYRTIAEVSPGTVNLYSRNNLSFNARFPTIVGALSSSGQAVYDGEVVIFDEGGRSSFQLLQNFNQTGVGEVTYVVFDLLYYEGKELHGLPLAERKEILRQVLPDRPALQFNDHVESTGRDFFRAAREHGLEGIVAKLKTSSYLTGRRSRDWLKIKARLQQEAVICGFTAPRGSRKLFGALVLGAYDGNGRLIPIGHSGGGFDEKTLRYLHDLLLPLAQPTPPFDVDTERRTGVTWVKPLLVCEVAFSEWTDEGLMRQPVFMGMRDDKDPRSVIKELPTDEATPERQPRQGDDTEFVIQGKRLKLTNLSKVYWPEEGYTKGDVVEYYREMAPVILPHLKDRPESLYRTPNGIAEPGFFQKEIGDYVPDWITTKEIYSESNDKVIRFLVCQDEADLTFMANLGCIEINPWLSRVPTIEFPDYFVIDLDPEDIPFDKVVEAALAVRQVLQQAGVEGYPKTSGATGIHIYVPLGARYDFDTATAFARIIATMAHNLVPEFTSIERSPSKRQKRVYLDYLQNRKGQTLAAPYSLRPRKGVTVSTPLLWNEVKTGLSPYQFTISTARHRVREMGDIFLPVLGNGIDIEKCLENLT